MRRSSSNLRAEVSVPTVTVDELRFDDDNEEKFWRHRLTPEQVPQILDRPHHVRRNRGGRRASHLLIGRDDQGRCRAVPIEPTEDRHAWRPVSA